MRLPPLLATVVCTLSLTGGQLSNIYQFDGYLNPNGEFQRVVVATQQLSNILSAYTLDDGGFHGELALPISITFPEAPAGATDVYSSLSVDTHVFDTGFSFVVEPILENCGGSPCKYSGALLGNNFSGPPIDVGLLIDGFTAHGQTFDTYAFISFIPPIFVLDNGFNSKTTMVMSGPSHYNFTVTAITAWEGGVPEPSTIGLAGFGLLAVAAGIRRRKPTRRAH